MSSVNRLHVGHLALTKQADVDLLQRVDAAELVELVVDLVEDQGLVVVRREVPHNVKHCSVGAQGEQLHAERESLSIQTVVVMLVIT